MATITFEGTEIYTEGEMPRVGSDAPDFILTNKDLGDTTLGDWTDKKKLLSIFPSIDTPVCALSTKKFDEYAKEYGDTAMLMISCDLPFAQTRFCNENGLEHVVMLSTLRSDGFGVNYGVEIKDGPLEKLVARAVFVLDENNTVVYNQLVGEVTDEPDYEAALKALGKPMATG